MNGLSIEHLHHNLKLLKLATFESILDNYLELAAKRRTSDNRNHRLSHRSGASKQRCSISSSSYKNRWLSVEKRLEISNSIVSHLLIRQLSRK